MPLIVFTTCVPAAVGLAFCALVAGSGCGAAACAFVLTTVGMVASIAHLARPLRAPRSLTNLASSWLSREILLVGAFWGLLAIWFAAGVLPVPAGVSNVLAVAANALAAALGSVLLFVIARAYRVSTRPAWCGSEGLMELWAGACGAGSACALLCAGLPVSVALMLAILGLVLDVLSHKGRVKRLERLASQFDERIPLTLAHYAKLMPRVRQLWAAESICIGVVVIMQVSCASALLLVALAAVLSVAQLLVHGAHRWVFYEAPVQVRYVARLRK